MVSFETGTSYPIFKLGTQSGLLQSCNVAGFPVFSVNIKGKNGYYTGQGNRLIESRGRTGSQGGISVEKQGIWQHWPPRPLQTTLTKYHGWCKTRGMSKNTQINCPLLPLFSSPFLQYFCSSFLSSSLFLIHVCAFLPLIFLLIPFVLHPN